MICSCRSAGWQLSRNQMRSSTLDQIENLGTRHCARRNRPTAGYLAETSTMQFVRDIYCLHQFLFRPSVVAKDEMASTSEVTSYQFSLVVQQLISTFAGKLKHWSQLFSLSGDPASVLAWEISYSCSSTSSWCILHSMNPSISTPSHDMQDKLSCGGALKDSCREVG